MSEIKIGDIVEYVGLHPNKNKRSPEYMGYIGVITELGDGDNVPVKWIFPLSRQSHRFISFCAENLRVIGRLNEGSHE